MARPRRPRPARPFGTRCRGALPRHRRHHARRPPPFKMPSASRRCDCGSPCRPTRRPAPRSACPKLAAAASKTPRACSPISATTSSRSRSTTGSHHCGTRPSDSSRAYRPTWHRCPTDAGWSHEPVRSPPPRPRCCPTGRSDRPRASDRRRSPTRSTGSSTARTSCSHRCAKLPHHASTTARPEGRCARSERRTRPPGSSPGT